MRTTLGAQCDDFHISGRLALKLDLSLDRETVLHFFDRVRRAHPAVSRFRRRDDGALVLEEADADAREGEAKRWLRLEPGSIRFGYFAPPSRAACRQFARFLLEQAPYHLTLSDLDIDYFEIVYGFDMEYRGNHDQLVAETLFAEHPLASFLMGSECVHTVDCQPYFGITLTPKCDMQAYLEIKTRTSSFEIRTGEYEAQVLSVYLTVQRFWGFEGHTDLCEVYEELAGAADNLAVQRAVPLVVNPLALAIASRR